MMKKTLGGDRLGSGKRMKVELHGYERSTHNLGYLWRSTMSAGTLVPFMSELALPGDTFDIDLDVDVKTHPTIGPLFASYKIQLDIFQGPIRLYQGELHNNKLGVGMDMSAVKLPQMTLTGTVVPTGHPDPDNAQINPSCVLAYLGIRGIATIDNTDTTPTRDFNAIPYIMYWDTYKNYYSNKQEGIGAVIHTPITALIETVDTITVNGNNVPQLPATGGTDAYPGAVIVINYTGATPDINQIVFQTSIGVKSARELAISTDTSVAGIIRIGYNAAAFGTITIYSWDYISSTQVTIVPPKVSTFTLTNLDDMREEILANAPGTTYKINTLNLEPYKWIVDAGAEEQKPLMQTQEGLAIKTYQSDLFNNWLDKDTVDNGITAVTAIDTSGGSFTIDTLNLSKKVYDMLNRVAVSGGTYDDWLDVTYDHDRIQRAETPIYHGGLIRELVFQEVVSNSASGTGDPTPQQPLGTLAGRGTMAQKRKGGHIIVKVDEPSYIMGIISLTPRIDYSQGNKWDINLKTMDDLHKPALDEIGFQDLIEEQMAWWTTIKTPDVQTFTQKSAGKQPAWINYMTNVNTVRGNFAIQSNEMFMTLNRRYERDTTGAGDEILDLTTYIDPIKFNHIFAQTSIDAQNFWVQIAVDITARRKMSAKLMPNL